LVVIWEISFSRRPGVPGRTLIGIALLTAGLLAGCADAGEQWDLPMSPPNRPGDIPLQNRDICKELGADEISVGCRVMADSGAAEVVVIPRLDGGLRQYSGAVDGDAVRWIGISRFPAIQLAGVSGSDGLATCRIALDVAPGQVLLVVYRQQAADPRLPPCHPARDYAARAISALRPHEQ
jgi:hypothetical protein